MVDTEADRLARRDLRRPHGINSIGEAAEAVEVRRRGEPLRSPPEQIARMQP